MTIKENIQIQISKGCIQEALNTLLAIVKNEDSYLYNQLILTSARWFSLQRSINLGLIDLQSNKLEEAKIAYSLLNMLEDVDKYEKFNIDNSTINENNVFVKGNNNTILQGVENSQISIKQR